MPDCYFADVRLDFLAGSRAIFFAGLFAFSTTFACSLALG
jgi:hypothetical protein